MKIWRIDIPRLNFTHLVTSLILVRFSKRPDTISEINSEILDFTARNSHGKSYEAYKILPIHRGAKYTIYYNGIITQFLTGVMMMMTGFLPLLYLVHTYYYALCRGVFVAVSSPRMLFIRIIIQKSAVQEKKRKKTSRGLLTLVTSAIIIMKRARERDRCHLASAKRAFDSVKCASRVR